MRLKVLKNFLKNLVSIKFNSLNDTSSLRLVSAEKLRYKVSEQICKSFQSKSANLQKVSANRPLLVGFVLYEIPQTRLVLILRAGTL